MLVKLSGETSRQKSDDWWQLLCSRWWYCKYIVCWVILSWVAKNNVHFIASDNYSICIPVLILFLGRFPVNPLSWSWLQHCRYQYSLETDQESFSGYNHEPVSFLVFFFIYVICFFFFFVFVFAALLTVIFITRRWIRAIFNNVNKHLSLSCSNSRS